MFSKYKRLRNEVISMLQVEKCKYFKTLSTKCNKLFLKTVKVISTKILTLSENAKQAFTDQEKSNMLNRFFSHCWNQTESPLKLK